MTPFSYYRPANVQEAVQLLSDDAANTKVLAGGQSLLLALKERTLRPGRVLSVGSLAELTGVREMPDGRLDIGAATTYATLARSNFSGWHGEIALVAGNLADRSVRTLGTIGGGVCHAAPRFDMPTLLTAAGAQMQLLYASGERSLDAHDFFSPRGGTNMTAAEILTRIALPGVDHLDALAFEKFRFRVFDAALVSVACALKLAADGTISKARIVLGAFANGPLTAIETGAQLVGRNLAELRADEIGAQAAAEIAPFSAAQSLRQRYQSELAISLTAKAFARATAFIRRT
jgi:aerobic carbon-monoxide dehydrogenase medium subunit